jgi:hypothetical protein
LIDETTGELKAVMVPDLEIDFTPRLICMIFADWAANTVDGKGVLAGVFDRVHLYPHQLGQPLSCFLFIKTSMMHEEATIVHIHQPDGKHIGGFVLAVPEQFVPYGPPNSIQIVSPITMIFPVPGVYWFNFWYRGLSVGQIPLPISILETHDGTIEPPNG